MIFAFGDCQIDIARRELRRGGSVVHVEPQVFDLLVHLIGCRDRVVGKDELFQTIWRGRIVSEDTLTSRISAARRAIGDSGAQQNRLRTVARRGFRFCGEVEERAQESAAATENKAAPSRLPHAPVCNLPIEATRLIGRDEETAEITALLRAARLVTLTGAGGVGKSRLAFHLARAVAANHPDGVWLVELAALTDPAATGHAVAGALGIAQQHGKSIEQSIVQSLAGRRLLVLLDNCEHLIDAAAKLARDILANCPQVTVLATSREALTIHGERRWPVPPLRTREGAASPAAELFVERARAAAPDFDPGDEAAAIAEICRRLDGIPLAIELAAARVRAMTASEIRNRLDGIFQLLTGGPRGAAARHRTLHAALQWSYDLLSPSERTTLARIAVFAGGFTLQAAEQICSDGEGTAALDVLDQLVAKSLATVERAESTVRFRLLEPIRQFAQEKLAASGENDAVHLRHTRYFAAASDNYFAIWRSPNQPAAYAWLDREIGNLQTAFRWANNHGDIEVAARIASNIGDMARFRLREDTANWAAEIVDAARTVRHRRLAVLLTWAASSAWSLGRLADARRYAEEAIALTGDVNFDPFVWAFTDLAMVECYEGSASRAIELVRTGAGLQADRHDRFCLAMLPHFLTVGGRGDEAQKLADRALAEAMKTAIPSSIAVALWAKGEAFADSDPASALHAYQQATAVARKSGNRFWEILAIPAVAALQARSGDPAAALRSFQAMLEDSRRSADVIFMSHGFGRLIVLFERLGYADIAATLYAAVSGHFESGNFVRELPDTMESARRALGVAGFAAANAHGAAMALYEATDYALDQVQRALSALNR